jgi:hypothetical protein
MKTEHKWMPFIALLVVAIGGVALLVIRSTYSNTCTGGTYAHWNADGTSFTCGH